MSTEIFVARDRSTLVRLAKKSGGTKPDPPKGTLVSVEWQPPSALCGDDVTLAGRGEGFAGGTKHHAVVTRDSNEIAEIKPTGTSADPNAFDLAWAVRDAVFLTSGGSHLELVGALHAAGQSVKTSTPLAVERVPDIPQKKISWSLTSGIYAWSASFRIALQRHTLHLRQTLHIQKAWLGKWISFDPTLDGLNGWAWVKKDGVTWKYWNTASSAWTALPRAVGSYTVNSVVFVKSGTSFVGRDNSSWVWPEAFVDPPNYATKTAAWLRNIHDVWDGKFRLIRKGCESKDDACCAWFLQVSVNWSSTSGDKQVYAVWAQDWERSNAKDWYLTENRLGVAGHECGHLLGAYDEYTGGAVDPKSGLVANDSIMGSSLSKAHARHLDGALERISKIYNSATSRNWQFEFKPR